MIPLYDFFFIGCMLGLMIIIAARILGKLPQVYGSFNSRIREVQSAFERFEKWHRSWKSYKPPRHIQLKVPGVERSDEFQNRLPDYLRESDGS